jgi:polyhydroxyalkanoate synthesis regulator protein
MQTLSRDKRREFMATLEPITTKAITIKAYGINQRLYNPSAAVYVSLDDLVAVISDDQDFVVHEPKTGEDITRSILKQIVLMRHV